MHNRNGPTRLEKGIRLFVLVRLVSPFCSHCGVRSVRCWWWYHSALSMIFHDVGIDGLYQTVCDAKERKRTTKSVRIWLYIKWEMHHEWGARAIETASGEGYLGLWKIEAPLSWFSCHAGHMQHCAAIFYISRQFTWTICYNPRTVRCPVIACGVSRELRHADHQGLLDETKDSSEQYPCTLYCAGIGTNICIWSRCGTFNVGVSD